MKAGESFHLTESWWKAGKPVVLTDTGLGGALRAFEQADEKFQGTKNAATFTAVMKALEAVNTARLNTIQKCGNNILLKDVKAALAKDGAIAVRKHVFATAMENVLEPEVKKEEAGLATETKMATAYEQAANNMVPKIAEARKTENEAELKRLGKDLGRISTNVENLSGSLRGENVKFLISQYGSLLQQNFPAFAGRLKTVKAASDVNNQKLRNVRTIVKDNSDIAKDE
jgi:hypothetical protein